MLLKMIRMQTTKLGTLHAGRVYTFDPARPGHTEVYNSLTERGMAAETTEEAEAALAAEKDEAARAVAIGEALPGEVSAEVAERGAVLAQEAEEAAKKGGGKAAAAKKPAARADAKDEAGK